MANKDMRIIVTRLSGGTVELPLYSSLKEMIDPNETDNTTLDGTLYTDFVNNRRSWMVAWEKLKAADYDTVRALFNEQYQYEAYHTFVLPEYGISAPMKINISDRNIRLNGEIIEGFSITLKEQYAIS
jgi:hypothetical protein